MNYDYKEIEEKIYKKLEELDKGTNKEKILAFDCYAILSNESSREDFKSRLQIVEDMIKEYELQCTRKKIYKNIN